MSEKRFANFKYKKTLIGLLIIVIVILIISIAEILIEPMGYISPAYEKIELVEILEKDLLSDDDYKELFYQTGLGKVAIDEILEDSAGLEQILGFQDSFFQEKKVSCDWIGIITKQESVVNEEDEPMYGFNLAPYKNGYVLLTKSTHSLGWRHGHSGIVTDAENGVTLEAIILGSNTALQNINKWRLYPSFIMLKLKDASQDTLDEIAAFAKDNLYDIPYGLTVGLTSKKNPTPDKIRSTQCAHVIWYPFMQLGYDVDSDGSWLVTPKDIANSDLFEIVQIHGVDPSDIWP